MNFNKKYHINENYFDDINTDEKAWVLGLLASDGNVDTSNSKNIISISQSGENGQKIIEYVKNILESNNPIRQTKTTRQDAYSISFSSKNMVGSLSKYNIIPRKTDTYTFPDIKNAFYKSFIRGYFEGDGSVGIYQTRKNIYLLIASIYGNYEFILKCFDNIPVAGLIQKKKNNKAEIRWNGKNAFYFMQWLYENNELYKDKKFNIFHEYIETYSNQRHFIYDKLKEEIRRLLNECVEPMEISRKLQIPFQYVYKWRKKWKK
jgi:hypothetical protein